MENQVYISCPIAEPISKLTVAYDALIGMGYSPTYWERGSCYNEEPLRESSAMILLLPKGAYSFTIKNLPPGCYREYTIARHLNIPIYIGYLAAVGLRFYETAIGSEIQGIAGRHLQPFLIPNPRYSFFNLSTYGLRTTESRGSRPRL